MEASKQESKNYSEGETQILSDDAYACNLINQGLNAEKATTELWPPNPNEFEIAAPNCMTVQGKYHLD